MRQMRAGADIELGHDERLELEKRQPPRALLVDNNLSGMGVLRALAMPRIAEGDTDGP